MLNNNKIKFLENMVKSLSISVDDLSSKVELMRQEIKEIKNKKP
ncbi:MAG: hypothetical protein WC307_03695 [Candidatus Nanoarchaeia archaeon]|jgi:outer membrane murein-binding lipoprotein Lpp